MSDVLDLPFDIYQRYRLVSELLEGLREKGKPLTILDVGGRTAVLRAFLPEDRITLVDLEPSEEKGLVLGDGSRLPFADASFDLVAAFDTLEHVPPARREAFVSECARVARRHVVLAGPYQAPEVQEAEELLQRFLKDKLAVEHRYLEEHRHNGLPVRAAVVGQLERLGAKVASHGHGNLDRWLATICMSMYMDYRPELRGIRARFQRFYNKNLYASDHTPPVYRHAIVAALRGAPSPSVARLAEPGVAPAGATRRVEELAFELVAFERAQGAVLEEKAKLERGLEELRTDLAGHAKALEEALARKSEQAEVIATLEADLEAHERSMADLRRDLEAQVGRVAEIERGHALEKETLETDLAGHKAVVAALERDLSEHQATLREVRAIAADVERELESLRALREKELAEAASVRAELEAMLAEHRRVQTELERELEELRARVEEQRARIEGLELVRADLERDRAERTKVVATLEKDLAAHRAAAKTLEAEIHARGAAIAGLENDLAQHKDVLASARADLAAHKETVALRERELDEHRAVIATIEQDLAGHRTVVAELRAETTATRAALEAVTHAKNETDQALAGAREEIASAREELRRQHELAERLRFELRGRWKGFKRAFGPKRPIP